jgi:hypothetical protein
MWELFMKNPEALIPITLFGGGALVGIVAILAHQWRAVRRTELEVALKQDMLRRGLSVEEIERVLRASERPPEEAAKADPVSDNAYALTEKMIEEGRSGEEIERLVKLLQASGGTVSDNEYALIEKMLDEGKPIDQIERVVRAFRVPPPAAPAPPAPEAGDPERPRETAILRMDV